MDAAFCELAGRESICSRIADHLAVRWTARADVIVPFSCSGNVALAMPTPPACVWVVAVFYVGERLSTRSRRELGNRRGRHSGRIGRMRLLGFPPQEMRPAPLRMIGAGLAVVL